MAQDQTFPEHLLGGDCAPMPNHRGEMKTRNVRETPASL